MKIKLKLIVLVVLIAVVLCTVLCACNTDASLLKRNDERYSKQVTASCNYNGRTGIVDVNELYTSFYRYYSYLYQYYQYGYISAAQFQSYMKDLDKTFADSNESLARNALAVLRSIDELYTMGKKMDIDEAKKQAMDAASTVNKTYNFKRVDQLEQFYIDRCNEIKAILNAVCEDSSYINEAIHHANEQMQSSYDSYVSTVRSEYEALNKEEDTTPENFTGIELVSKPNRLVYEVSSNATISLVGMKVQAIYAEGDPVVIPNKYLVVSGFDASKAKEAQEITVTYGDYSQKFTVDIVEALTDRSKSAEDEKTEAEEIAELIAEGKVEMDKALNAEFLAKFSFTVDESDFIKEGMTAEELAEATKELKIARTAMKRTIDALEKSYRSYDYYLYLAYNEQVTKAFTQKVTSEVQVTAQELNDKYDELVNKALNKYADTDYSKSTLEGDPFETIVHKDYSGEQIGYFYVSHILFKFDDETQAFIDDWKADKVSSDEFIEEYIKSDAVLSKITVWESNPDFDSSAVCEEEECGCPRCSAYTGEHVAFDTLAKWYGLDSEFDDPCRVVDEDGNRLPECKFGCKACPVTRYTKIVNAYDVIASLQQELADCETVEAKNEKMLEYIYKYNMDGGMFTNINKDLDYLMTPNGVSSGMVEDYEKACQQLAEGEIGDTIICRSKDYGIFFIMLTGKVADLNDENVTKIEGTDYVKLALDYITNKNAKLEDGENPLVVGANGNEELTVGSIAYYIWQDLYAEAVSIKLARGEKAFFEQYADSAIEYFPNTYKTLIKQIQKGNA